MSHSTIPHTLAALLSPAQQRVVLAVRATAEREAAPAYLVGGAVRDWLLGRRIDDLDFAVEGDAIAFTRALMDAYGGEMQSHQQFHTATWIVQEQSVDVVTARAETYARPAALPQVRPASITDDLLRRDFSVDALALALRDNRLIDVCDGQGDLQRRLIRALHARSFIDDPTRIFRAARYAARLDFAVEPETRAWINHGLPHVGALSGERVKYDLELIFLEQAPARPLSLLRVWDVFRAMGIPAPEDDALNVRFARLANTLATGNWDVASLDMSIDMLQRAAGWGALIYNLGQLSVSRWVDWIPFTARLRDALISLGALSTLNADAFHAPPSRQSELLGVFSGLALWLGWLFDRNPLKRQAMWNEWHIWRRTHPTTTGEMLKARGLPPGPRYSQVLGRLRNAWLDGEVTTPAEEDHLLNTLLAG